MFRICCDITKIISGPSKPAHFLASFQAGFVLSFGFVFVFSFGFCGLGRMLSLNFGEHRRDLSKWSGQNGLSELEEMVGTWANGLDKWSRLAHMNCPFDCERHTRELNIFGARTVFFGFEKCCPNGVFQTENEVKGDPADDGQNYRFT